MREPSRFSIYSSIIFPIRSSLFSNNIQIHCHVLEHEDQGAMATALIRNGCDNDYGDVGDIGSCHYVNECDRSVPVQTAKPIDMTLPTTPNVPSPVILQPIITRYQLHLRGSYGNFRNDANVVTGGDMSGLGLMAIEQALDYGTNPELKTDVIVNVESVGNPKVIVTYTLLSTNQQLLSLCVAQIDGAVQRGDVFTPHSRSYRYWFNTQMMAFSEVSGAAANIFTQSDDEWKFTQIATVVIVMVAFLCYCCCLMWIMHRLYQIKMEELDRERGRATSAGSEVSDDSDSEREIGLNDDASPTHLSMNIVVQTSAGYEGPTEVFEEDLQRELDRSRSQL